MSDTLPIYEYFHTVQGEGIHMGRSAFFIRTYGCPVHCPWCDSAGTWHKNWVPPHIRKVNVSELADEAYISGAEFVVITGGEPAVFDLTPLTDVLKVREVPVHLETSGAFDIKGDFDWITVSPKRWRLPLGSSLKKANEFKFIIEIPVDISYYSRVLEKLGMLHTSHPIWLHPEWSQRENSSVLKAICEAVKMDPGRFRAGWQLHKLYQVDQLDERSKALVPLGGEEKRGF